MVGSRGRSSSVGPAGQSLAVDVQVAKAARLKAGQLAAQLLVIFRAAQSAKTKGRPLKGRPSIYEGFNVRLYQISH